jgi:hypothetical protein
MDVLGWVCIAAAAWVLAAVATAVLIGRVIAARDRQVPRPEPTAPPEQEPERSRKVAPISRS